MDRNKYKCPFGCGTTIIRLPLDSDFKNRKEDQSRKYVVKQIENANFRFVQCPEENIQSIPSINNDGHIPFYKVDSFWDFDNIGVTKHVGNDKESHELPQIQLVSSGKSLEPVQYQICRYLTCGACDKGAVGFGGYVLNKDKGKRDHVEVKPNDLTYFVSL